jgi:hypothetical protein
VRRIAPRHRSCLSPPDKHCGVRSGLCQGTSPLTSNTRSLPVLLE